MRNQENAIRTWHSQIKQLVQQNKEINFGVSVYENDSSDKTKELLKKLNFKFVKKHTVTSENINTKFFGSVAKAERLINLANARNKCINQAIKREKYDYIIFIEPDIRYNIKQISKLLNKVINSKYNFDIVSPVSLNSNNHFYDKWATRKNKFTEYWYPSTFKKGLLKLYSTFSCFCIYNAKPIYQGLTFAPYNNRLNKYDCDTAVICENFQEKGYSNIFMDTDFFVIHPNKSKNKLLNNKIIRRVYDYIIHIIFYKLHKAN
ncbi:hypothetical protein HOH11_00500 [Candidatus Woesearchaeota archaeon]|jgi:hypothetical protein|nr:hypothetical protein [Candidatus Woesearchaeota archaeon]MBT6023072.1 hypothetical protein [Candidatus Woesearchaeota archaeon]